MREALLIFRKDLRHLWPWILLADVGIAAIAVTDAMLPRHMGMEMLPPSFVAFWFIAVCYLVVALVHEEKTVGDTRYWLTRPFPRHSIVLAKLLFVLAFLYLPLALGQIVVLAVNGISLSVYWGTPAAGTLFSVLTGCIALAGMAAVTRGMVQFILTTLLWLVGYLGSLVSLNIVGPDWPGLEGIRSTAVWAITLLLGSAVVWLMYSRRQRAVGIGIVAGSVAALVVVRLAFPWHLAFAIKKQSAGTVNPAAVQVAFNPAGELVRTGVSGFGGRTRLVGLSVPVKLSGVPGGMEVTGNRVAISLQSEAVRWNSSWDDMGQLEAQKATFWFGSGQRLMNGPAWLCVTVDPAVYSRMSKTPVHLRATIAITLLGKPYTVRMSQTPVGRRVPGDGFCAVLYRHGALVPSCIWGSGEPQPVDLRWRDYPEEPWSFSPGVAAPGGNQSSIIWQTGGSNQAFQVPSYPRELYLDVRQPVAYFERELDIPAIRLADFHKDRP